MDFTLFLSFCDFFFFFCWINNENCAIKKHKCFLNSNDFEDKNEHKPCFNSYRDERKKNIFAPQK